jgi:hypothetical protein
MANRSGRKSASQTPAPAKDRIIGSKVNPKGSASSEASASKIKLDAKTLTALTNKLKEFKEANLNSKNITLADLKAVYRRGAGAYSTSHRPTISGGKPNSRNAWAMARVNKFLLKAGGTKVKKAYVQDDDLMEMHLGGDMSKHLAPNGKPSNLTHEQWHLVRTPEFKAWFGDWEKNPKKASKVVDENGEPMVVYHATNKKFWKFEKEKQVIGYYGKGFYFSSDLEKAKDYGKRVIPTFLNIKNPFSLSDETPQKLLNELAETNVDVVELGEDNDIEQRSKYTFGYASENSDIFIKNLNKKGFDGIKLVYDLEDEIYFFIAFDSNQIKLADGSNTTFDGANPDIRYADGGEVNDYVFLRFGLPNKNSRGEYTNSYTYDNGQRGIEEGGISVFEALKVDNHYKVFLPNSRIRTTFEELLRGNRDLYIVDGEYNGNEGFDGEMLLDAKTFEVIKKIDKNKVSEYNSDVMFDDGGEMDDNKETYKKWKLLVNMSKSELEKFYNSEEGKEAGLSSSEAKSQGISSGRESARWIMKMKDTPVSDWTPTMWKWANKQISFISRMSGNKGGLYDDKGNKTRKHTSLLIWGHNPERKMHLGGDMSLHLPLNGGISYLTHEQWHLVRTPEFKAWFGDWEKAYETNDYTGVSKVLQYNMKGLSGEPMVCGHASYNKFSVFNTPSFFQSEGVGAYGDESDKDYTIYNVFLSIKNPLDLKYASLKEKFVILISDILKNAGLSEEEYKSRVEFAEKYADGYGLFSIFTKRDGSGYHWEWVYDYCKKNNYDGFVMKDSDQSMSYYITTWVALLPEQIKLADGTNTTFDGSNPDIRYAGGGEVDKQKFIDEYLKKYEIDRKKTPSRILQGHIKTASRLYEKNRLQEMPYRKYKIQYKIKAGASLTKEIIARTPNEARKEFMKYSDGDRITSIKLMKMEFSKGGEVKANYRIIREDGRIKYAGTDMPSWLTLETARKLVNYSKGEMIYQYDEKGNKLWEVLSHGGTINSQINTNIMDNVRFNQLPQIDTISEGDNILIHESVFSGNINNPTHMGERYIHCRAMSKGGMLNSLNLEVIKSVGANPLVVGQMITRPIANVMTKGRKMIVEPIEKAIEFKKGGLNPDNKEVKGYFAHGSGNAGGVLVGKRHSEGGIKAINKSTGQPLEMEGGEVVITRGAVSNPKKYDFDGKEMTTREILSKLNVDGGGVSFAEGGDVPDKMNCGCKEFKLGGQTITPQDFVAMSEKEYQAYRLQQGIKKERNDHYDTLSRLNSGAITIDNALREIAEKEMSIDKKYPFAE